MRTLLVVVVASFAGACIVSPGAHDSATPAARRGRSRPDTGLRV